MTHRVSGEALRQIEAIGDYIAKDSPLNAKRWLARLHSKLDSLSTHPERHAVVYSVKEAGIEVRQTFYGVYRILYSIDNDLVHVLAIRHGARRPIGPEELLD